eukprot:g4289.t1
MTLTTQELQDEIRRLQSKIQDLDNNQQLRNSNSLGPSSQILEYTNGDRYEGEVLILDEKTLRHGQGTHQCSNGDSYNGGWYYDRRHGKGKLELRTGSVKCYDGEWNEDQTNGNGICMYRDGSIYKGEFANDVRSGWGNQIFPNGDEFEGEWTDDLINGNGRWTMKNGSYMEGQFEKGAFVNGKHVNKSDQTEYIGSFKDGLPHGDEGTLSVLGEWTYKGEFQYGKKSGRGVCEWNEGYYYEGEWSNDQRNGKGKLAFRGQFIYEGEWRDDKKHGQGKWCLGSGDIYTGTFVRDAMQGKGIMIYQNGDKYKGEFSENKRHGLGKCVYKNGDKYKGEWKNDARDGKGYCRFHNKVKFKGQWSNDHWIQTSASPSKTLIKGEAVNQAIAGHKSTFQIEARDDNDQRRLSGGDNFKVVFLRYKTDLQIIGEVIDHDDGTYTASYEINISGNYDLYILLGDDEIVANSPYTTIVVADVPDLKHSVIEMPNLEDRIIPIDKFFEFYISPRDRFGNECVYDDVIETFPIEVRLGGRNGECPVQVDLGLDGRYYCSFQCSSAGNYILFVASNSKQLPKSPKSIQIGNDEDIKETLDNPSAKWKWVDLETSDYSDVDQEDSEQAFIKAHPDVPVITDLEDLWKLGKLQRERKKKKNPN